MITAAGFEQLTVAQNDRMWSLHPPYDTPEQTTVMAQEEDGADQDSERAEARRFALAGGLDDDAVGRGWEAYQELQRLTRLAISEGRLSSCGDGNLSIFAARSPAKPR